MLSYIITAIVAIFLWELAKDLLNIRNIFSKYDGLSSEEALAIKRIEEKCLQKNQKLSENKDPTGYIDD